MAEAEVLVEALNATMYDISNSCQSHDAGEPVGAMKASI